MVWWRCVESGVWCGGMGGLASCGVLVEVGVCVGVLGRVGKIF